MSSRILSPLRRIVLALVVLLIVPVSAAPRPADFDSLFVFGDSLADVGNIFLLSIAGGLNPPVPPSASPHRAYFLGRFSNGPVGPEYLWQQLSGQPPGSLGALQPSLLVPALPPLAAVDFAFGATGVGVLDPIPGGFFAPGLTGQIQLFADSLTVSPSPRALYVIITGSNEYIGDVPSSPQAVVASLAAGIRALAGLGARTIVVATVPDLSTGPLAAPDDLKRLSKLSQQHNLLLKHALHDLRADLDGVELIEVDVNEVIRKRLPKDTDTVTPALDAFFPPELLPPGFRMSLCIFAASTCADVPTFNVGLQYQFWDALHPTTEVHRLFGEAMYEAVTR